MTQEGLDRSLRRPPADRVRRACVLAAAAFCLAGVDVATASGNGDVALPRPSRAGAVSVEQALALRRSVRAFAPEALPLAAVSQLLWAAQGVTGPDGLRTAPSAGALYPLEVHLVAGAVSELRSGVYRYDPGRHRLVLESEGDARVRVARAALSQDWIAEAPAIVVLAAVHERTARKYGERAPRFVHMEVGHAAQNVCLQAVALGLGTTMVGAFRDEELAGVLGLAKHEQPLALLPIGKPR
jgi:SagB-type dehydrogenase family enzyme